jgi:hypothetical protein
MKNFNNLNKETQNIFSSMIIEELEHNCLLNETIEDRYGDLSDLHHKLFNEYYFIIGYYEANCFIKDNFSDAFEIIDIVKEYEEDNFGQFNTPLNSESIVNMFAYIVGEELIYSLNEDEEVKEIIEELKNL